MSINKVILIGNIGKDPEIRVVREGNKVANFSIATTERYKDKNYQVQEQTEWHNIVIWGPLAEVVEKFVKKGSQVYIEGKMRTRSYQDQSGTTHYVTEVLANTLQLLGKKPEGQQVGEAQIFPERHEAPIAESNNAEGDDLPF